MQPVNASLATLIANSHRMPIGRVKVYQTNKSCPSKGFNASFYALADDTNMIQADWWSGLSADAPVNSVSEGTFLTGSHVIEPSTVLAFDWRVGGVPAPVTGRSDLWAARWYGHFFCRYAGIYRFYVDCSSFAKVRIKVDATYYGTGATPFKDENAVNIDRWDDSDADFARTTRELYFDTGALTQGIWYAIAVEFWVPKLLDPQNMPTYLCIKYREPDDTTNLDLWGASGGDIVTDYPSDYQDDGGNDIKKPLSAGVVNTTGAFLTGTEIFGIESISGRRQAGEVSEYQFEINIPASTNLNGALAGGEDTITVDSTSGFPEVGALNIEGDHVTYMGKTATTFTGVPAAGVGAAGAHSDNVLVSQFIGEDQTDLIYGYDLLTNSIGAMRAFRLVQIEGGLNDGAGNDYYADRIWGHIFPGPAVDRDNKKATITVRDFGRMLVGQYDRNYPDNISYSMADYYDHYRENVPDGISRPPCYDRWDAAKAVRDILMRANIDPVLLYQRDRHRVTGTYAADYGQYMIRGGLYLDSRPHYGQPRNIERAGADDKYIWTFGYGTSLWENLIEIIKNYSFQFGFTPSGFARAQPFGWPDDELWCDDVDGNLTFTGAEWNDDDDNVNNFGVFRARYRLSTTATDKVAITTPPYWNDAEVILQRHDGANQKIKVKVGAAYVTQLIIDGALVNGTGVGSDEFAIAARGAGLTWSYYDGVDAALGVNPCIIQLADVETYSNQALEVVVVNGEIRFNAIFLYKRSPRSSSKSIGNDEMGTLRLKQDIESQRNEIDVIGAEQGLFKNIGGNIINPNNPIYVHTVSRALDLDSIYNENADNYIGAAIPIEIYDERIYDQERADYVSIHALDRYRLSPTKGSTNFLFDPTLEPIDVLTITDEHTRMLNSTKCWILGISESIVKRPDGSISYLTTINSVDPREPMPSMRTKPAPDITDWDSEPLVNIELHYRGFRVAGSDATYDGPSKTITITTSPAWTVNMWAGYRVSDQDDHKLGSIYGYEIESNTADTLVLVDPPPEGFTAGNWCIIFDPLDSEAIGAPLEIHYDQVANAKIEAYIADKNMKRIADLNVDVRDLIQHWGPDKRIYWSGIIHYGFKEHKGEFYASPFSLDDYIRRMPLIVVFVVSYEISGGTKVVTMKSHVTGLDMESPSDYVQMSGVGDTSYSPRGAAKLIPQSNDTGCYLEPTVSATGDGTVLDAGRLYKYTVNNGTITVYIEGNLFDADEHNGKYLVCGRSGVWKQIDDTGNDGTDGWLIITATESWLERAGFTGHWSLDHNDLTKQADLGDWPWVKIVDMPHPIHFRETDNSNQGLIMTFDLADFYVEGLHSEMFKSGFEKYTVSGFVTIRGEYKTICEEDLTVNYKGTPYTITAGDVKHAQLGDISHEIVYTASDAWPLYTFSGYQIYWSINDPTHLYFSRGLNPDTSNPIEGLYVIGEIKIARGDTAFHITCATKTSIVKSLIMIPTIEIHQLSERAQIVTQYPGMSIEYEKTEWDIKTPQSDEIKLQGYEIFQAPRDISISMSPKSIRQSTNGDPLYFMQRLSDGAVPDKVLWLFLVKIEVYDRLGRPPNNMAGSKSFDLASDDESNIQAVSESDYYGIPALWDPGAGYNIDILSGGGGNSLWVGSRKYQRLLNSARAISLVMWEVT